MFRRRDHRRSTLRSTRLPGLLPGIQDQDGRDMLSISHRHPDAGITSIDLVLPLARQDQRRRVELRPRSQARQCPPPVAKTGQVSLHISAFAGRSGPHASGAARPGRSGRHAPAAISPRGGVNDFRRRRAE